MSLGKDSKPSAWIPIWISVLALVVSGTSAVFADLGWRNSTETIKLANVAKVDFDVDPYSDDPQVGIAIRSSGHGSATVERIVYFVDGRPVKDLDAALAAANLDPDANRGWSVDPGYEMGPGEVIWLLDYHAADDEATGRLVDFIQHRVQVKVNYCSVRQECEVSCFPSSSCGQKVSGPTKRVASESRPNPRGQDGTDRVR
jgi:hypothetical protein